MTDPGAGTVRVMFVDDHRTMADLAGGLLDDTTDDLRTVGSCGRGDQVLETAERTDPDVVVMNIGMPGGDGIQATKALRRARPNTRILIWSVMSEDPWAERARTAGASGLVSKAATADEFVAAVRAVARGGGSWPQAAWNDRRDSPTP